MKGVIFAAVLFCSGAFANTFVDVSKESKILELEERIVDLESYSAKQAEAILMLSDAVDLQKIAFKAAYLKTAEILVDYVSAVDDKSRISDLALYRRIEEVTGYSTHHSQMPYSLTEGFSVQALQTLGR